MEGDGEWRELIYLWKDELSKATDFDLWGQPVEATDSYNCLLRQMRTEADMCSSLFTEEQKKTLHKIATCLGLRCKALQTPSQIGSIKLEDLQKIKAGFVELLSLDCTHAFPVSTDHLISRLEICERHSNNSSQPSIFGEQEQIEEEEEEEEEIEQTDIYRGNLLPPVTPIPGKTFLTIRIEKMSIKDAAQYIDCFMTVSVKDIAGVNMSASQDTPVALQKRDNCIIFGVDVFIQDPLESFPPGFAVFFEFKHYKPKKKAVSIKCWAFMERDEIKEGLAAVELYKKPTDIRRKRLHLLTVKPMYLHLKLMIN